MRDPLQPPECLELPDEESESLSAQVPGNWTIDVSTRKSTVHSTAAPSVSLARSLEIRFGVVTGQSEVCGVAARRPLN
jgi:hypothetical protein